MTKKRQLNSELYRTFLMFGICLYHAIGCAWGGGHFTDSQAAGVFGFCVDGFAFISGYYGIKLKFNKILKLELIGLWCALVACLIGKVTYGEGFSGVLTETYRIYASYWFLHSYVFLMLVSPVLNSWLNSCVDWKQCQYNILSVLFLVFGWAFMSESRILGFSVPAIIGFDSLSPLPLVGSYIVGGLFHRYDISRWPIGTVIIATVVAVALMYFGLSSNLSPFSVLLAAGCFYLFCHRPLDEKNSFLRRSLELLGPSLFPVYLITTNNKGFLLLDQYRCWLAERGLPVILTWFVAACTCFFCGVLLDIPRRVVLSMIMKAVAKKGSYCNV